MLRHEQVTQTLLGQCILVFGSVDGWKGFIYFYFFLGGWIFEHAEATSLPTSGDQFVRQYHSDSVRSLGKRTVPT